MLKKFYVNYVELVRRPYTLQQSWFVALTETQTCSNRVGQDRRTESLVLDSRFHVPLLLEIKDLELHCKILILASTIKISTLKSSKVL